MMEPQTPLAVYQTLDVRGYQCPLPILKTKIALRSIPEGATLKVLATDPMAVVDFRAYCAKTGHELLHWIEAEVFEFYIRKGQARELPNLAAPD